MELISCNVLFLFCSLLEIGFLSLFVFVCFLEILCYCFYYHFVLFRFVCAKMRLTYKFHPKTKLHLLHTTEMSNFEIQAKFCMNHSSISRCLHARIHIYTHTTTNAFTHIYTSKHFVHMSTIQLATIQSVCCLLLLLLYLFVYVCVSVCVYCCCCCCYFSFYATFMCSLCLLIFFWLVHVQCLSIAI